MAHWSDWGYYPPSQPRKARGGIKAQSQRGQFAESWWARRWIEVMESFDIGARLNRGRTYARKGQVLSIDIDKGKVQASVQGSRPTPYRVTVKMKALAKSDWKALAAELGRNALFMAKLLNGEMPPDIEKAFAAAGLSLFPRKLRDLATDCSCPDWSNPCKHIAAVYYLLGEEFDRDPFLIFKLRGIEREELIRLVGQKQASGGRRKAPRSGATAKAAATKKKPLPAVYLPASAEEFWAGPADLKAQAMDFSLPSLDAALPKRLGKFPLWRGETSLSEHLETVYREASRAVVEMYLNQPG